jgi:hypothetical protein
MTKEFSKRVLFCDRHILSASGLILGLTAITLVVTGCSGPSIEDKSGRLNEFFEAPALISGPASALLTNVNGFSAHVELVEGDKKMTGLLLGKGTLLLLANERGLKHPSKKRPGDQTYFIWDAAQGTGFVVNEPMQGYATLSSSSQITEVSSKELDGVFDTIDGHRCRQSTALISLKSQNAAEFSIWKAADLKNFPMQIKGNNGQLKARFYDVRLEAPSSGVFVPPANFTLYTNSEMMLSSLIERQTRSKLKPATQWDDDHLANPQGTGFSTGMGR